MRPALVKSSRYSVVIATIAFLPLSACLNLFPESIEDCQARFEALNFPEIADKGLFAPVFTYELSEDAAMPIIEEAVQSTGETTPSVTQAIGPDSAPREAFFKADVPDAGAYFFSENVILFRIRGAQGSRQDIVKNGCSSAPEGGKLVRIESEFVPRNATQDLAPQDSEE